MSKKKMVTIHPATRDKAHIMKRVKGYKHMEDYLDEVVESDFVEYQKKLANQMKSEKKKQDWNFRL